MLDDEDIKKAMQATVFQNALGALVDAMPEGAKLYFKESTKQIRDQILTNVGRNLAKIETAQIDDAKIRINSVIEKSAPEATTTMKEYLRSMLTVNEKMTVDSWKDDIIYMLKQMLDRDPDVYFSEDEMLFDMAMKGKTDRESYDPKSDD